MAVIAQSTPESLDLLPSSSFAEAAEIWFGLHSRRVSLGTQRDYRNCISALTSFFSHLRLEEIRIQHLTQYQQLRSEGAGGLRRAGPSRVNHELNTLSQILNRADLWAPIARHYQPLRLPRPKVGCALSPEDEERLFRVASGNPRWKVAYLCSLLTANTTAGPGEIRHLRLQDVDLHANPQPMIHIVEGVKNEYRQRKIPLNDVAASATTELLARARRLGAIDPEHYLLPLRRGGRNGLQGWDPTRPITSWGTAWAKLREAAGLGSLRRYDLRHHAITKLLENEKVSERTVIDLAGHVSRQMLQRYSHIRTKSRVDAVNALNEGSRPSPVALPAAAAQEPGPSTPIAAFADRSAAPTAVPRSTVPPVLQDGAREPQKPLRERLHLYRLKSSEFLVLTAMCEHSRDGLMVSASVPRLAAYSKLSERTVQHVTHALRARGILSQISPGSPAKQAPAIYRLNDAAFQEDPAMERYRSPRLSNFRESEIAGPAVPGPLVQPLHQPLRARPVPRIAPSRACL